MRIFALCLMSLGLLIAKETLSVQFTQDNDRVLVPKTKEFIDRLGAELLEKTGFLLKVVVVEDSQHAISTLDKNLDIPTDSLDSVAAREMYKQYLQKSEQHTPYAMIVMYIKDKKIDFVLSDRDVFDKKLEERVYFEYMVPLLPKGNDNPTQPQISAILFNGYSEAADLIAQHYGKSLALNIPRDESGGREFVKISMLFMLSILFGVVIFVYVTSKFFKK